MSVICLVDNTEHDTLEYLHLYLRKLKITQEKYYTTYYAKKDLLTGDSIPFKTVDQYLSTDFTDKRHLKKWVLENPERGQEWCLNWLKKRITDKELVYAPTQAELNTLSGPSMHYFESIGGYNKICAEFGLKLRFDNKELSFKSLPKDAKIIVDTREQQPLNISIPTEIKKVDAGDYALDEKYDKKVYIERKNMMDFMGTLTRDLGRFHREIERAKEAGSYIVTLIECPIADVVKMDFIKKKMKHLAGMKVTSAHVFKNMRDTLNKYDNIQFLFVANRREAAAAVIKIFELREQAKSVDLQFKLEKGEFNVNSAV